MKRLWIFPAIVCLLLLISWPFRWEKAMVQSVEKDMKVIHLRDRWTNQKWVILYGFHNGNWVSGEIKPVISEKDIEKRKERKLAIPKQAQEIQELQHQINEYGKIKELHGEGHLKYIEFVKKEKTKRAKEEAKKDPSPLPDINEYLGPIEGLDELLLEHSRYEEYEDKIPKEIINEHIAWISADAKASRLSSQIYNFEKGAEDLAETELNQLAWLKRNIATGVWFGLVLSIGVLAFVMFRNNLRIEQ